MTGPLVVSLFLHALLILAFVLKWNLDKPKRPGGGGGGSVVHAVVIDQLQFKQHAEFVKQQKQQKQAEELEQKEQVEVVR